MLTEDELKWIRSVLVDDSMKISPSYFYRRKKKMEWLKNKTKVRQELDKLRKEMLKTTPKDLLELKDKSVRESRKIKNFEGIYIIHNRIKDIYYVGQSKRVLDRAYMHFIVNPEAIEGRYNLTVEYNFPEIYFDYNAGNEFIISLIPLIETSFSSLNELEGCAIIAYNSLAPNGYNRVSGNMMDKPIFKNDDYKKAMNLIFNRIKETEGEDFILNLTNQKKRRSYTLNLFTKLRLPRNPNFYLTFLKMLTEYRKYNKK
ncbi:excinuclease ABC subunit C [Senegalia massiliensis]|uniref:Excinuclease ABC subunit C n=1 Tax=Senegalia massiliensis TaxID=1720316 RepID=A0A845QX70_9CLOT|nr:excinuclease ABC subunit C [Senegalia massiliensis]NBI06584.1 excinuclease ABC subunit C [Senegalia massiliensis]